MKRNETRYISKHKYFLCKRKEQNIKMTTTCSPPEVRKECHGGWNLCWTSRKCQAGIGVELTFPYSCSIPLESTILIPEFEGWKPLKKPTGAFGTPEFRICPFTIFFYYRTFDLCRSENFSFKFFKNWRFVFTIKRRFYLFIYFYFWRFF